MGSPDSSALSQIDYIPPKLVTEGSLEPVETCSTELKPNWVKKVVLVFLMKMDLKNLWTTLNPRKPQ